MIGFDDATNLYEIVSSLCSVSTPFLTQSTRFSKLEANSTFILLQAFCCIRLFIPVLSVLILGICCSTVDRRETVCTVLIFVAMPTYSYSIRLEHNHG